MSYTQTYTRQHLEKFWFDPQTGLPKTQSTTTKFELDNFTEFFIHLLSDHLECIEIDPDGCTVDRLHQFKDLYIQCMLQALYEYEEDSYTSP